MTATATVPNHRIGARNKNLLREIILMVDRDSRDYAREIANAITLGIAHEIALYYIDNNANLNSDWKAFADRLATSTRDMAAKLQAESTES
jgi:hypothetical protein